MVKDFVNPIEQEKNTIPIQTNILKEDIKEQDKNYKYLLNLIIFLGGSGFLITGISSYIGFNLVNFLDATQIIFFPQGITMCFYGTLGVILSINQTLVLFYGVGEGYNEFDKLKGTMRIFRKGFPGKNSDIDIVYSLNDILRKLNLQ